MKNYLPKHYRVSEFGDAKTSVISMQRFLPVKETEKGYWVIEDSNWIRTLSFEEIKERGYHLRWVHKESRKRYCYPSIEEALNSFYIRKQHHVKILREKLGAATLALENFESYRDKTEEELMQGVVLGDESRSQLFFG